MQNAKKLLLLLILPMILISCDRKPDLAYLDACAHPDALKEIKYYVKHKISDADGLIIAAKKNTNEKIVKELLKSKNIEEGQRLEALWYSMENKNIEVFKVLLKDTKGANSCITKTKETILMRACEFNSEEVVKILIKNDADVNARDKEGRTALMIACDEGNKEIVNALLAAGADVNIKDKNGTTLLMTACEKGDLDLVNAFIEAKADVNAQNDKGKTALMVACDEGNKEIVNALLAAGADVNIKDKNGTTLLMTACEKGDLDLVNAFIEAKADVNAQNDKGKTALMVACDEGNKEIVDALIRAGADVNIKSNNGTTLLMTACEKGDLDLVNALIEAKADVNAQNDKGKTALMIACEKGNKDIVNALIKAGSDIKIKDNKGATALIYSLTSIEIKNVLLKAGADPKEISTYFDFKMIKIPSKVYEMLSTEVTQKLYKKVMGTNPSKFKGDNLPVENVNWYDAVEFCNALSQKMGLTPVYSINGNDVTQNTSADGFRLPTVEEWQYAARGGQNYTYAGSNNIEDVAWYSSNSESKTHPVAQKKPNGYGLYDMSGNVREWCWDVDSDYDYHRYMRGGSWDCHADDCEVSYRRWDGAGYRGHNLGFRPVRTIK